MEKLNKFSLLWPKNENKEKYTNIENLSRRCIDNLGLKQIAQELSYNEKHYYTVRKLLLNLCDNPKVINYRLDIMEDFINNPELLSEFEKIFELINQIHNYKKPDRKIEGNKLRTIAWRLKMLEIFSECMQKINALLSRFQDDFNSEGMQKLYQYIKKIVESELFQSLKNELPDLKDKFDNLSCVTIGINLNASLQPKEAVFLSIESEPFQKESIFSRLFGLDDNEEKFDGISAFQKIISKDKEHVAVEQGIFKELNEIFQEVLTPIGKAISRYVNYKERFLINLQRDLYFYIGATRFIKKMCALGFSMCKPEVLPKEKRSSKIENIRDLSLALGLIENKKRDETGDEDKVDLGEEIVPNDIDFGSESRIFILTGPNQGGKTTFTRAIGIAQVLFQAGIFVPGTKASISPVDWVYTHFTEKEKPNTKDGRLGEESRRLSRLFQNATSHSLILLNESLSSTSPGEGLYLLKNIVKGIRLLGCRCIFTTHLHKLAAKIDAINSEAEGDSKVGSLVAEVDRENSGKNMEARRTFKIVSKPPEGKSFARDVDYKDGISYDQIKKTIEERKYLDNF